MEKARAVVRTRGTNCSPQSEGTLRNNSRRWKCQSGCNDISFGMCHEREERGRSGFQHELYTLQMQLKNCTLGRRKVKHEMPIGLMTSPHYEFSPQHWTKSTLWRMSDAGLSDSRLPRSVVVCFQYILPLCWLFALDNMKPII